MDDTESEPEIELRTHRKKKMKPSKTDGRVKTAKALYGLRVSAAHWAEDVRLRDATSSENNPIRRIIQKTLKTQHKSPRKSATQVIEPAHQIAPTSYLGKALDRVKGKRQWAHDSDTSEGSSPSLSSSNSSQSSDDDSSSPTLPSSSGNQRHRMRKWQNCHTKNKTTWRRKRSKSRGRHKRDKSGYGKLKPIAPTKYDGSPDSQAYYCFLTEGAAY